MNKSIVLFTLWSLTPLPQALSFSAPNPKQSLPHHHYCDGARCNLLGSVAGAAVAVVAGSVSGIALKPSDINAAVAAVQESLNIENFLRTGIDLGGIMCISSQVGKL